MADAFTRTTSSQAQLDASSLERLLWSGSRGLREFLIGGYKGQTQKLTNEQMASRGSAYRILPIEEGELSKDYFARVFRTYLTNYFKRAVTTDSGKVFANGITVNVEGGDQARIEGLIQEYMEDIDLEGTSGSSYFQEIFKIAEATGVTFSLVQFSNPSGAVTLAEQLIAGSRAYCTHITSEGLIGWDLTDNYEDDDPIPGLESIRWHYTTTEMDGFEEAFIEYVLEIMRDSFTLWKKDSDITQSGDSTLGFVPLVACNFNPITPMTAIPPYRDLADLNLAHYQSSSDQTNILHYARVPFLHIKEGQQDESEFVLSANRLLKTGPEGEAKWVEIEGNAIEAGSNDLESIEQRIQSIGLDLVNYNPAQTATGRVIDSDGNDSSLKALVPVMEDHIKNTLITMLKVQGENVDGVSISVTLNEDFSSFSASQDAGVVKDLVVSGNVSMNSASKSPSMRKLLGDDYNAEADAELLDDEARAKARRFLINPNDEE